MVNKNLRCKINIFFLNVQLFVLLVIVIGLFGLIRLIILTTNNFKTTSLFRTQQNCTDRYVFHLLGYLVATPHSTLFYLKEGSGHRHQEM